MRAITRRVGLPQSDGKIGSHTTKTVNLSDFSCFNSSSAAEAPRKQPGQVGDKRSTIRTFEAARLNSLTKGASVLRRVSGGWSFGVTADPKKYQARVTVDTVPRSDQNHLLCDIRNHSD